MKKKSSALSVSIVIPNWNGVYLMKKHLEKVILAAHGAEVVVADDMSSDGSVEYLRKNFPSVIVVANQTRKGFAGNVNTGVAKATGEIVMLLNTDVVPDEGFMVPLLTHFDDPAVFAVGCLERSFEKGAVVFRGRGVAQWKKGYYQHERGEVDKKETAWVSGGSGVFRRSMWQQMGGMDELFNPFYWEDIDISYRARKMGWQTLFEPASIVNHYHEEGKIRSEFTPLDVKRIAYRNQYIFIWKNLTDFPVVISHIAWVPIRLLQSFVRGEIVHIQGFFLAFGNIYEILKKRQLLRRAWKRRDSEMSVY